MALCLHNIRGRCQPRDGQPCKFRHKACLSEDLCSNANCKFGHSEAWNPQANGSHGRTRSDSGGGHSRGPSPVTAQQPASRGPTPPPADTGHHRRTSSGGGRATPPTQHQRGPSVGGGGGAYIPPPAGTGHHQRTSSGAGQARGPADLQQLTREAQHAISHHTETIRRERKRLTQTTSKVQSLNDALAELAERETRQANLRNLEVQLDMFNSVWGELTVAPLDDDTRAAKMRREINRLKSSFPCYAKREVILDSVRTSSVAIIMGETGSGKSTQVAQYLAEDLLTPGKKILVTQPRKVAAQSLAARVAEEWGCAVGSTVGFEVGGAIKTSSHTQIVFCTDQVLLNKYKQDRTLREFEYLIIDEVHERSINIDLILGLLKEALQQGGRFKLVLTSATLNKALFLDFFQQLSPSVVEIPGRTFPVETHYQAAQDDYVVAAVRQAVEVHRANACEKGDILIFLAGQDEIDRAISQTQRAMGTDTDRAVLLPLHGKLQPEDSERVFKPAPSGKRKVIFATNVAETSVTIEGVVFVIDTGMAKVSRFDARRNMSVIAVDFVTQSSVKQRRGRAGRTRPGVCYHLYSEEDMNSMEDSHVAEILRSNLARAYLRLKELGVARVSSFPFIEPPNAVALQDARELLQFLGALDVGPGEQERLTDPIGTRMARLTTLEPMLARTVLAAADLGVLDEAIMFAGIVASGGNIFYRGGSNADRAEADVKKAAFCSTHTDDALVAVSVFRKWLAEPPAGRKKWCLENCVLSKAMMVTYSTGMELRTQLRREGLQVPEPGTEEISNDRAALLRRAICHGYFANCCVSNGSLQAGYTVAKIDQPVLIHPGSTVSLSAVTNRWVVYTELAKTSRLFIRNITNVELEWIIEASARFSETVPLRQLERQLVIPTEWLNVGPGLIGSIIGRQGANLTKLETELQCTLEINAGEGTCRLWCSRERQAQVEGKFRDFVQRKRQELMDETIEAAVAGSTRAVVGAGGLTELVLLRGMFTRVVVREVAPEFKWEEEPARALFERHSQGGSVRSVRCLGKASDNRSSWGLVEMRDVASAQRLVDNLDGSTLADFGTRSLTARPSLGGGSISDGSLVLSLRETSIKVHWFCGESTGTGFVNFDGDGYALLAYEALQDNPLTINGQRLSVEMNPRNKECLILKGLSKSADDIAVEKVLKNMGLAGLKSVAVPRKASGPRQDDSVAFDAAIFLSLWTACGPIESVLTFPPSPDGDKPSWKGKAYIRFSQAVDAIEAVERYNGKAGVFGTAQLHVQPDFSWTVNISCEVYDVMRNDLERMKEQLLADFGTRIKISTVDKAGPKGFTIKVESVFPQMLTAAKVKYGPILSGHIIRGMDSRQEASLFDRTGRAKVQQLIRDTRCFISLEHRTRHVRLFHPNEAVRAQAEAAVLEYAKEAAQLDTRQVQLPPGGGPALVGADSKGLSILQERTGAQVAVDFMRKRVTVTGTTAAVEEALRAISEVLAPLSQTVRGGGAGGEECGICTCDIEEGDALHQLIGCGHRFHRQECAERQLKSAVEGKAAGLSAVSCASCNKPYSLRDISALLSTEDMLDLCKSSLSKYIDEHPHELRWCPTKTCSQVASLTQAASNRGLFQCPDCMERYCLQCPDKDGVLGVMYHDGMTCAEYKSSTRSEEALKEWMKQWQAKKDVKACPKCKVLQEKVPGTCNKFHCAYCGVYFCWKCLEFQGANAEEVYKHLRAAHGNFYY